MIIQGNAIQTNAGSSKVAKHIFEGEQNERIETLKGNRYDMKNMIDDAKHYGKKYGFVHFKMNPKETLTPDQEAIELQAIAQEYKFSLDDSVIVKHTKPRADKTSSNEHYHIIAPYCDSKGKAMNLRSSYKRNEKLGRLAEMRAGQTLTNGRFNTAVFGQLVAEGKNLEALQIMTDTDNDKPFQSHTHKTEYALKKKKININAEKQTLKDLWKKSDSLKAYASALNESGYIMKEGDKPDTFIILKGTDFISAANRIVSMKKDDFKKLYEKEIQNVQKETNQPAIKPAKKAAGGLIKKSTKQEADDYADEGLESFPEFSEIRTEEETGNIKRDIRGSEISTRRNDADSRIDSESPVRGSEPDRPNLGSTSADIIKSGTADTRNQRNVANAIAIAKINRLNSVDFHDISHVRIVTPDYLEEIKTRLKQIKTDDAEYFSNVYKNLKEQNREIWKYNKQIDHNAIALIIDAILRLLFGYTVYKEKAKPVPIQCPYFHSPIDKDIFDTMTKEQKRSVTFQCFVKARTSFRKHDNFMKKWEMTDRFPSFQAYLQSYSGDFMADEIINMYPQQYIKELEKSENITEREIGAELRKIKNGQGSEYAENYTSDDLKICIETIAGEIEEKITMQHDAEKVRIMADEQAKQWNDAIQLQEDMSKCTRTPDLDFVAADIIDEEIGSYFRR